MTDIGFTGTQRGMTDEQRRSFGELVWDMQYKIDEFHHGSCVGSDIEAAGLVHFYTSARIVAHPGTDANGESPKYVRDKYVTEILEPRPYLIRNHNIVDTVDRLIATPKENEEVLRSGTWATIRYAEKRGKPVDIIYPDGRVVGR